MGSDGLWDQFDANGKKLNSKRFGRFLIERWDQTLKDQEIHINLRLDKWKGDTRQTDDMLLLGFRA
jgi:serine phosphatase RsbU (regulator of sigma subunit)